MNMKEKIKIIVQRTLLGSYVHKQHTGKRFHKDGEFTITDVEFAFYDEPAEHLGDEYMVPTYAVTLIMKHNTKGTIQKLNVSLEDLE